MNNNKCIRLFFSFQRKSLMVHPKIVLGTMTFGTGDGGRIQDHTEITKILDDFNSRGYDELDTARSYCGGNTEQVLNQLDCSKLFKISTKAFPFHPGSHKPDQLENQLNESLAALGQSKIDIFYLHAPDHSTPFEKTCSKIDQLYKKGKFTRFGLSNFPSWAVMEIYQICKHNGYVLPTVYQGIGTLNRPLLVHIARR